MTNESRSYDPDIPLEVRERELKLCVTAIREYLDRLEATPVTERTAVVFATGSLTNAEADKLVGYGSTNHIQRLLLEFTLYASELEAGA